MDIETGLKRAVLRVRDILRKFARSKGWHTDNYRIFMRVNVVWGNMIVELVARAYDHVIPDENERYDEVLDFLEKELIDDVGLYESINLLICPFFGYWFQASDQPFENYVNIDERLLNPDVEVVRPVAQEALRESE